MEKEEAKTLLDAYGHVKNADLAKEDARYKMLFKVRMMFLIIFILASLILITGTILLLAFISLIRPYGAYIYIFVFFLLSVPFALLLYAYHLERASRKRIALLKEEKRIVEESLNGRE